MRNKKYYHVKVVTASSADEAREKLERGNLDYDCLNDKVVPGKKLYREISKRTVVPVRHRNKRS